VPPLLIVFGVVREGTAIGTTALIGNLQRLHRNRVSVFCWLIVAAIIDAEMPLLALLVVANTSLTIENWSTALNAAEIRIENLGTLKLPLYFKDTQPSNRIHIVCDKLKIAEGGVIDAAGGGYAGGVAKGDIGAGPGGATVFCFWICFYVDTLDFSELISDN
jgi:hypothetical protein